MHLLELPRHLIPRARECRKVCYIKCYRQLPYYAGSVILLELDEWQKPTIIHVKSVHEFVASCLLPSQLT